MFSCITVTFLPVAASLNQFVDYVDSIVGHFQCSSFSRTKSNVRSLVRWLNERGVCNTSMRFLCLNIVYE
jgi:hypothetical protein